MGSSGVRGRAPDWVDGQSHPENGDLRPKQPEAEQCFAYRISNLASGFAHIFKKFMHLDRHIAMKWREAARYPLPVIRACFFLPNLHEVTDRVGVLRPTGHEIDHFRDVFLP